MGDDAYEFDGLPLSGVRPGTTVLVSGPSHVGTRELGLRLLAGHAGEGAIVVTTNRRASRVAADCERVGIEVARDRTAILDCVGDEDAAVPARVLTVSGPDDLTGIGMRYSNVYREFLDEDLGRVRTGLSSISTLLTFSDLRTVSRFVHTLVGRVAAVDGFGALRIDPTTQDDLTVNTIAQFCDGRIDVREREDGADRPELRVRGLSDQSRDWEPFEPIPD